MALPVFLKRVRSILHLYRTSPKAERHILQGCLCCLETLAAMTLAPAVTDIVLPPSSRLKVSSSHALLTSVLASTKLTAALQSPEGFKIALTRVHDEKESGRIAFPLIIILCTPHADTLPRLDCVGYLSATRKIMG